MESAAGVLLLVAASAALLLANSPLSASYFRVWDTPVGLRLGPLELDRSVRHWINDGVMTLFFFVVALEIKRELVRGELRSLRVAALSLSGALGGMLVPACVYLGLMQGASGASGWGTVMATDTAFVIGGLGLLGSRIPASLRLFLVSLAIFDDVGAMIVVAVGYGGALKWPALLVAAGILVAIVFVARVGIRSVAIYIGLGAGVWFSLDASGIHPTIAGVVLGLITPAREWVSDERLRAIFERVISYPKGDHWRGDTEDRADLRRAGVAAREALSPVERLELMLHPWSGFLIMPLFAFANAGVRLEGMDFWNPVTGAVIAGLAIGKPVGVIGLCWLAVRLRLAIRPADLKWSVMAAGALLTGIGFTMSLFIAGLAFDTNLLGPAKIGIFIASALSGSGGLLVLLLLTRRHPAARAPGQRGAGARALGGVPVFDRGALHAEDSGH